VFESLEDFLDQTKEGAITRSKEDYDKYVDIYADQDPYEKSNSKDEKVYQNNKDILKNIDLDDLEK